MRRADLLSYILSGETTGTIDGELESWLEVSPRFEQFLSANRDKIRKKLRTAGDDAALLDVRAELMVAARLAADRRFDLEFEAYGAGKRGPDLTVTFRANQRFNVEVTRLRPAEGNEVVRVQGALLAKCRQLPAATPNAIALVVPQETVVSEETIAAAARRLKQLADRKEEETFTRRGYESASAFLGVFVRLSAVLALPEGAASSDRATQWINPAARRPLSRDPTTALGQVMDVHVEPKRRGETTRDYSDR